jgi:hypothetical protein
MTRKNTATLKAPKAKKGAKAKKTPAHRVRKGSNELNPTHGIVSPSRDRSIVASKKKVVIPMPEIGMIEVDDAWINGKFQRFILQNGIDDLIREYDGLSLNEAAKKFSKGCGLILAARRKDGKISIIDGQRRIALAKHLKDLHGVEEWFIHAEIVDSEGNNHEAMMFKMRNHRKKLNHCEEFKGDLAAGDAEAVGIDDCLIGFGLTVKGVERNGATRISCVTQLREAWRVDGTGKHLDRVLKVSTEAWATNKDASFSKFAYKGRSVGPISIFIRKFPGVDIEQLAKKLSMYRLPELVNKVSPSLIYTGYTRNEAIADHAIAPIYKAAKRRISIR